MNHPPNPGSGFLDKEALTENEKIPGGEKPEICKNENIALVLVSTMEATPDAGRGKHKLAPGGRRAVRTTHAKEVPHD